MRRSLIIVAGVFALMPAAFAGDVSGKGPNGGKIADAVNMHVEFVSKGMEVSVFTYDHDNKPMASTGMTGRITVQEGGKTRQATLAAEAPNRLKGTLEAPLASGARVVVSLTPKGGKPVQARYTAD